MIAGRIWNAKMTPRLEFCSADLAEDERRARVREVQHGGHELAQLPEERLPRRHPQHEDGEGDLQAEPPGDGLPADGAAVPGQRDRDAQNESNADEAGQPGGDRHAAGARGRRRGLSGGRRRRLWRLRERRVPGAGAGVRLLHRKRGGNSPRCSGHGPGPAEGEREEAEGDGQAHARRSRVEGSRLRAMPARRGPRRRGCGAPAREEGALEPVHDHLVDLRLG